MAEKFELLSPGPLYFETPLILFVRCVRKIRQSFESSSSTWYFRVHNSSNILYIIEKVQSMGEPCRQKPKHRKSKNFRNVLNLNLVFFSVYFWTPTNTDRLVHFWTKITKNRKHLCIINNHYTVSL